MVTVLYCSIGGSFRSNPINRKIHEITSSNHFLYPKYFINRSYCRDFLGNLWSKAGLLNAVLPEAWNKLWLGDQSIVIYSLAFALIWQAIGYYMVMYMAGMAKYSSDGAQQ